MGIKERQERDREAIRRSILDAARELFVTEGYQNVSIRKIAERIEYSPAAIYSYFPSKDDIFFALAEEGFRQLSQGCAEEGKRYAKLPPLARVRAGFWHLYEFSREHSEYFALMFLDRSVPRISREYERFAFARAGKRRLVEDIQRCIDTNVFSPRVNAPAAFTLLTMGIVGVAAMRMSQRMTLTPDVDAVAGDMLDVILAGLQAGVTLHEQTVPCPVDEFDGKRSNAKAS